METNFIERYLGVTPAFYEYSYTILLVDVARVFYDHPSSTKFFLMGYRSNIIILIAFYALFVKKWGPNLMKNRKGFELRGVLITYNSLQVAINAYIVSKAVPLVINNITFVERCLKLKPDSGEDVVETRLTLSYMYCMVKVFDLFDTVFFVLRKRYNQVTFLHFYHHLMVCLCSCLVFQYASEGHLQMIGFVNSSVHVVMYFYYLLSSFRSDMKNSIWWKKYITLLQILQFVYLLGYLMYPLLIGNSCGYPLKLIHFSVAQNCIMLILFSNFYIKTYIIKSKPKVK